MNIPVIDSNKFKASVQTLQFQLENIDKMLIEIQKDKTCHENTINEMGINPKTEIIGNQIEEDFIMFFLVLNSDTLILDAIL